MDAKMEGSEGIIQNETPSVITDTINLVFEFLSSYGWILLAGLGLAYYLKHRLEPRIQNFKESIKKPVTYDSEAIQRKQDALDKARRQMQEKHDQLAQDHAAKQKEKEEKSRAEKVEDWNRHLEGKGYRSKRKEVSQESNTNSSSGEKVKGQRAKNTLRNTEFSPLMGGGANTSYRPPRRGGGGGGG